MDAQEIKSQFKAVFNEIAPQYDSNQFFSHSAKLLVDRYINENSKTMLDVATGTGAIATYVAKKNPHLKIVAIDHSQEMLNQAKKKAIALKLPNIEFVCQDAENISNRPDFYDIITCGYGLFFFPEMEQTFKHLYHLLGPDGRMIFSTFSEKAFQPFTDLFLEALERYEVKLPKLSRGRLNTAEKIDDLCKSAGIRNVETEFVEMRYQIPVEGWWNLLNSAGYKGLIKLIADDKLDQFKDEHLSRVAQHAVESEILLVADTLYGVVRNKN